MEKQKIKPIVKEYGHGIIIEICPACFSYEVCQEDKKKVFRGITISELESAKNGILRTKENPRNPSPNFYKFFSEPYVSLGPLSICGVFDRKLCVFLEFDVDELKQKYPNIRFMNYSLWDAVHFHPLEGNIEDIKKELFFQDYMPDVKTEVLADSLDLRLASFLIGKNKDIAEKASSVVDGLTGKKLDYMLIERTQKIWRDYVKHLSLKCDCKPND